jgi:hypothetical protein
MLFKKVFTQSRHVTSSAALIAAIEIYAKELFKPQITQIVDPTIRQ